MARPSKTNTPARAAKTSTSTALAIPANLRDELAADAADSVASVRSLGESANIGTKGGRFSFRGNDLGTELECVVLGFAHLNEYYADEYDPNVKGKTPDCYAVSRSGDAMKPHEAVANPESGDCASCPLAAIGSDRRGRGRACKQKMRLILIHGDDVSSAQAAGEASVARLAVPSMSKNKFGAYVKVLAENPNWKLPLYAVRTKITLVPDPKFQFVMEFSPIDIAGDAETIRVLKSRTNEANDAATAPFPVITQDEKPKATGRKPAPTKSVPARRSRLS